MNLFEAIPEDLFSILASPNRKLYADALDVLYIAYLEKLRMPEEMLYSMLRSRLESELEEATFDGEDIDEEELRDISGRARFLIRKLNSKGWIEKERGNDFKEYIIVPGYSSQLLELLHELKDDSPARGYSYVFGTYSALKVANESDNLYDKMSAVYGAYDNTQQLIKMLQRVYHNIKRYFQIQIDMHEVNEVLASHFDHFGQKVVEAYIRPLKIKDSVPKYKIPIQTVLRNWTEKEELLNGMARLAFQEKRGGTVTDCRADILQKIFWIEERYDNIEQEYLAEIDIQVRRYTRAATQKVENLLNRDQSIHGNLNILLTALAEKKRSGIIVEQIQPSIRLFEQNFLSERSLWYRKRPAKRTEKTSVRIDETMVDVSMREEAEKLLHSEYGKKAVREYVKKWLGDKDSCDLSDVSLENDKDYIMTLLAVLSGQEKSSGYRVEELGGSFTGRGYTIPQMRIIREERK